MLSEKTINISIQKNRILFHYPSTPKEEISEKFPGVQISPHSTKAALAPLTNRNWNNTLKAIKELKKDSYQVILDKSVGDWVSSQKSEAIVRSEAAQILLQENHVEIEGLKLPLRKWQHTAVAFLEKATSTPFPSRVKLPEIQFPHSPAHDARRSQYKGAIIADEMGLGKTFEVMGHLLHKGEKAIIVVPASIQEDWVEKITKLVDCKIYRVTDSFDLNRAALSDIVVMSFGKLKKHVLTVGLLAGFQNRVVVIDEAQDIRNPGSGRNKRVQILTYFAKYTVAMTGTPVINNPRDLYPVLLATRRLWSPFNSFSEFNSRYSSSVNAQKEIMEKLKGVVCRRLKTSVWLDGPEKSIEEIWVPQTPRYKKLYQEVERDFVKWLRKSSADGKMSGLKKGQALVKIGVLRQICAASKLQIFRKILNRAISTGEQVVVFCNYNNPLINLAEAFANARGVSQGIEWAGCGLITGKQTVRARQQTISTFQKGKIGILFCATKAAGLGFDFTRSRLVFHLDLPWTPAAFEQASDRVHRIGQLRNCRVIKILCRDTVDERIQEIIFAKAEHTKNVLDDEDALERVQASVIKKLVGCYINN